jgi:hypothetical protein
MRESYRRSTAYQIGMVKSECLSILKEALIGRSEEIRNSGVGLNLLVSDLIRILCAGAGLGLR